jgi:hypothetical protein
MHEKQDVAEVPAVLLSVNSSFDNMHGAFQTLAMRNRQSPIWNIH